MNAASSVTLPMAPSTARPLCLTSTLTNAAGAARFSTFFAGNFKVAPSQSHPSHFNAVLSRAVGRSLGRDRCGRRGRKVNTRDRCGRRGRKVNTRDRRDRRGRRGSNINKSLQRGTHGTQDASTDTFLQPPPTFLPSPMLYSRPGRSAGLTDP